VDSGFEEFAYEDNPLPIAERQTISQPYIVALMIEAAEIGEDDRVLEVGAGLRLCRGGSGAAGQPRVRHRTACFTCFAGSCAVQKTWLFQMSNFARATELSAGPVASGSM